MGAANHNGWNRAAGGAGWAIALCACQIAPASSPPPRSTAGAEVRSVPRAVTVAAGSWNEAKRAADRATSSPPPAQSDAVESLHQFGKALSGQSGWSRAFAAWNQNSQQSAVPRPEPLSAEEWQSVLEGWTVSRALEFELDGRVYLGGAAYQIIAADSEDILETLIDPEHLKAALPLTHDAVWVSPAMRPLRPQAAPIQPQGVRIELHQGPALLRARYTVQLVRTDVHTLRFEVDRSRKHDIRDARGFFTAHQLNSTHSLVTVFVGVDLGGRFAQALVGRSVQRAALATPAHIRKYLEPMVQRRELAQVEDPAALARRLDL